MKSSIHWVCELRYFKFKALIVIISSKINKATTIKRKQIKWSATHAILNWAGGLVDHILVWRKICWRDFLDFKHKSPDLYNLFGYSQVCKNFEGIWAEHFIIYPACKGCVYCERKHHLSLFINFAWFLEEYYQTLLSVINIISLSYFRVSICNNAHGTADGTAMVLLMALFQCSH